MAKTNNDHATKAATPSERMGQLARDAHSLAMSAGSVARETGVPLAYPIAKLEAAAEAFQRLARNYETEQFVDELDVLGDRVPRPN